MPLLVKTKLTKRSIDISLGNDLYNFTKLNNSGYEAFSGECIPYYEFDNKYLTKEEQESKTAEDYKIALDAVVKVFNQETYPNCIVYEFSACGYDPTSKLSYKNLFHFRIRKAGYYSCGLLVPKVEFCDDSVYKKVGSRQLLRLIGCSKEENTRPLIRIENNKTYQINELKDFGESLDNYIVSNTENEKFILCYDKNVEAEIFDVIKTETIPIRKLDTSTIIEEIDIDTVNDLIDCLSADRSNDFKSWI